jgi:DNA-directed RNA polymerase sigma subunit (sigma70/sigma32)
MYFGFGCTSLTLEQIADRFGVHSERIRQLKEESLNIIKDKVKKYLK